MSHTPHPPLQEETLNIHEIIRAQSSVIPKQYRRHKFHTDDSKNFNHGHHYLYYLHIFET